MAIVPDMIIFIHLAAFVLFIFHFLIAQSSRNTLLIAPSYDTPLTKKAFSIMIPLFITFILLTMLPSNTDIFKQVAPPTEISLLPHFFNSYSIDKFKLDFGYMQRRNPDNANRHPDQEHAFEPDHCPPPFQWSTHHPRSTGRYGYSRLLLASSFSISIPNTAAFRHQC